MQRTVSIVSFRLLVHGAALSAAAIEPIPFVKIQPTVPKKFT